MTPDLRPSFATGTTISYADVYQLAGAIPVAVHGGPNRTELYNKIEVGARPPARPPACLLLLLRRCCCAANASLLLLLSPPTTSRTKAKGPHHNDACTHTRSAAGGPR